ncbi:DUF4258 domain-containing protein [Falsiroseomonas stagni]|uniref:DUF4258 domain-containing protein n=1 Tax=Falsiroseomonas stagni DSM 19981 TaxID=1123062 RepID=A0A1I4DR33_9PROT|nr:DUF4258 domain-containing protein [Falsiroseomonas stagni]SFK96062.1 protein of unknown function [Falsiroseomonas stagni DSM 19981]
MIIRLSIHAERRLRERGIPLAWIEAAIAQPDRTAPDPADPTLVHAFRAIGAAGGAYPEGCPPRWGGVISWS